jgi:hypothetical protein
MIEIYSDATPEEVYAEIAKDMTPEAIQKWLQAMHEVSMQHLIHCSQDTDGMDEMDESFAMYEHAFLYLYGLALSHRLLDNDHGELH